ncbi:MAG: prolyl oligopeptidase family serine peptidase [Actinobacteria bacterium]|uniref:Unannotated protein n=1 Tax=freshwater metagenome TaxID=449393 RepID=A0A6J6PC42_9ZZZZ|nr:prolyl oligopeptidase family serine peptidase [Actinomycetota bacterium]
MRDHDHQLPTVSGREAADLAARYRSAAALLPERQAALMRNRRVEPMWTGVGDSFTYVRQSATGEETVLVDPAAGTREIVEPEPAAEGSTPGHLRGPDGRSLFLRDHDLWAVDLDGRESRLTDDGEAWFAWGALPDNSMMAVPFRRMGIVLPPMATLHSPSGRFVLTMRVDERGLVPTPRIENVAPSGAARPEVHEIRIRLDDEEALPAAECRILDLDAGTGVEVDVVDGLGETLFLNGTSGVFWSADESRVFLLRHPGGGRTVTVVEVDTATGTRRDTVHVEEDALFEANQFLYSLPLLHVLPETEEAVLFSQRDGWGHLYLHDLRTGMRRHRITDGDLVVRDLLHVDAERREVLFVAGTDEPDLHPGLRRVYRASLDGGRQQLLTPEPVDHDVAAPEPQFFHLVFGGGKPVSRSTSPSGRYFVDHQSTVEEPPVIVLRDAHAEGAVVMELERTDVTRLLEAGYRPPRHFRVRSEDGSTDLWGAVALPDQPLDPERIPIVEHVYAGFQIPHVPVSWVGGGKTSGAHGNLPSLTALGFAAVMVDGRGTPGRDREFRQWTSGHHHTTRGLEDHVTALRGLAEELPQLDLTRVGVVGHSYGGYHAARLMLMFPEVYRAGVSSAGVHDPRKVARGGWSWHMGAGPHYDRTTAEYLQLGNLHLADRLAGDLLLCCGEIDENATVDHTFALADALIRAGKRFDLKIWPGLNHYQLTPYVQMCFWDHFTRSLLGLAPPSDFTPA